MRKSDILSSISLKEIQSEDEINATSKEYNLRKDETYITIDGKKYFVSIDIPLTFSRDGSSDVIMNLAIFVFGTEGLSAAIAAVITQFGVDAFTTVLTNINTQLFRVLWSAVSGVMQLGYTFLRALVGSLLEGEAISAAFIAGQAAVGEAVAEGVFSAITVSALAYTLVGILVIAVIYVVLNYVLHYSYHNVYVYNLTKYDLDFDFNYIYQGSPQRVESKHLPARAQKIGPGGVLLGIWYSGSAFRFQSDSQFHGLGYAMSLNLKNEGTHTIHKSMSCMFHIPYVGNNFLLAKTSQPSDFQKFYLDSVRNPFYSPLGTGMLFSSPVGPPYVSSSLNTESSASDDELEVIVTYDYLDGKHRDPDSDKEEYIYTSLVIIRETEKSNIQPNLPEVTGISWNPPNPVYANTVMTISWKSVDKAIEYDVIILRDDTTQILHRTVNSNSLNYSLQEADMFHSLTVKISARAEGYLPSPYANKPYYCGNSLG